MNELVQNNQKQVIETFDNFLKPKGFKKRANTWFLRNTEDVIVLINFQKSAVGPDFYLNFGIYFDKLVGIKRKTYPSYDWQFRGRYDVLVSFLKPIDSQKEVPKIFHLGILAEQLSINLEEVRNNIEKLILPFLDQWADYGYLSKNFPHNFPPNVLLTQNYLREDLKIFFNNQSKLEFRPAKEVFDEIQRKRAI